MNTDKHGCRANDCGAKRPEGTPQKIGRGQVRASGRGPRCASKKLLSRRGIGKFRTPLRFPAPPFQGLVFLTPANPGRCPGLSCGALSARRRNASLTCWLDVSVTAIRSRASISAAAIIEPVLRRPTPPARPSEAAAALIDRALGPAVGLTFGHALGLTLSAPKAQRMTAQGNALGNRFPKPTKP